MIRRLALFLFSASIGLAWGPTGHCIVNQLALDSLPPDFPRWARVPSSDEARLVFLANVPDLWRNTREQVLNHVNAPDHVIDLEQLAWAGIDLGTLTPFRYDFIVEFVAGRAAHPDRFPPIDPKRDRAHDADLPGTLPWAITEYYAKLVSTFSSLLTYERFGGTPEEIADEQGNALYLMGVMGHFAGDASQPLHTTVHHHGWVGPNPQGYTRDYHFHAWIDSGFIEEAGITAEGIAPRLRPARRLSTAPRPDGRDPIFVEAVDFIVATNRLVEPLYRLEKDGPLRLNGPANPEGRAFIESQLLRSGQWLGDLWLTAWAEARPDRYLEGELARRRGK